MHVRSPLAVLIALLIPHPLVAADWPMWRYDAGHTASSPHDLPGELHLSWTRVYSQRVQVWDDPLNHDLMPYDKVFEPVAAGGRVFVNFNDRDKVVALDAKDGSQLWEFFTDGPVRFPAVAWQDKVYFVSDDGYLYCVNAADGKLAWKFAGAPGAQKAIGNHRVISAWPARGAPVIRDGSVYFAASIWPFMGTFLYSLDAETGEVQWVNDGTSAQYIKQPHSAPSFAGVAPQGTLCATEDLLLVPGGRSVPAGFDRKTGEFRYFHIGGKGNGGSVVLAGLDEFYVHTRVRGVRSYDLKSGSAGKFTCNEPVLAGDLLYTATDKGVEALGADKKKLWQIDVDASGDLIRCGNRLYAAGEKSITAIQLAAANDDPPKVAWTLPVDGLVLRLLAADDRLLAVTLDGRIMSFAAEKSKPKTWKESPGDYATRPEDVERVAAVIKQAGAESGYALAFDADHPLLNALLSKSKLRIVAVYSDPKDVADLRKRFDSSGSYGSRITVHPGTPASYRAPSYMAHLVVAGPKVAATAAADADVMSALYRSVRPFGGTLWLQGLPPGKQLDVGKLEQARTASVTQQTLIMRPGPLPGAADWTHQYGDIANTVKSDDQRVKLPLGLLWFGGSSNLDVLPRHGHGPPEQVIGGRLIIEGHDCLSARDVYTGRVLWKREFDLGTFGVYFDHTYQDTPLSTAYNQKHIPGANGRGTNYIATADRVYLAVGSECLLLDAATGETVQTIKMPSAEGQKQPPLWGFIGVYEDVLLGGAGFADYNRRLDPNSKSRDISDMSASAGLVAFDRHSGKQLWRLDAELSFLHNGIVAGGGRVYCLDKLPKSAEDKLKRRGLADPEADRIVAVDAKTGKVQWEVKEDLFGTWLAYSQEHDIVFHAGAKASGRMRDEVGRGMATFRGRDGSLLWRQSDLSYTGPCILHNDLIITTANSYQLSGGAYRLADGKPHLVRNPITGKDEPLRFARSYGCNTVIASENLLTFRSGAAGFYDLEGNSGTGNFGGFKSSCTSNLVIAGGVLNAPDYTRTCSCSYQNQTSLALVHMPDVELWTFNQFSSPEDGQRVKQLGINLGAPGDRRSENGTLWLDFPSVGGTGPVIKVDVGGKDLRYFRRHASVVKQADLPWVAASGVEGIESLSIRLAAPAKTELPAGFQPQSGEDDAEESPAGLISLDSSDLELVSDREPQTIGIRFPDVKLADGTQIESAVVQFTVDETTADKTELLLHAEAAANAAPFREEKFNITSRKKTKASVAWKPPAWPRAGEQGAAQRTPDVTALIREVIGQKSWKSGNALALIISGTGKRVAESYNGQKQSAPRLIVKLKGQSRETPQPAAQPAGRYTVRLHFFDPPTAAAGPRMFDVSLQGKPVLKNFDLARESGGALRGVTKVFPGVEVDDELKLEFSARSRSSVLSGIELVAEDP